MFALLVSGVVVHSGLDAALEKRRKHRRTDETAAIDDEAQLLVVPVAKGALSPAGRQCEYATGLFDARIAWRDVFGPTCDRSISMLTRFISATISRLAIFRGALSGG
ncbi:hypothetical protein LMG28727_06890 [Paraburkholderia kirstenboschensis]|nr:hypothetical protein LMG28727_06890 [Paraburkholderia kirstenboschensis]